MYTWNNTEYIVPYCKRGYIIIILYWQEIIEGQ